MFPIRNIFFLIEANFQLIDIIQQIYYKQVLVKKMADKITTVSVMQAKGKRKMTMLTAYDYPTAKIFDQAKIDMLLVGDSMGNTVYGYNSTIPVTLEQTIDHCQAVANGAKNYSLLVGDMPFLSYGVSVKQTVLNAGRIIKEGKME